MICVLLVQIIGSAIQLPLRFAVDSASDGSEIANAVAIVVSSMIATSIAYPYMAAVLTILYFDRRVRKEGFDIQLLAEGLGVERDPDAPLPAPLMPPPYQPNWQPPPPYGPPGGWAPPSAGHAPPPRWGPAPSEPADDRPAEESPWMTPQPPPPASDESS